MNDSRHDGDLPPEYAIDAAHHRLRYAVYQATSPGVLHTTPPAIHYLLYDEHARRWIYATRIPKKREGWKAEVCAVTEKDREVVRYEVRREPLARKFDFRPPNGVHNVMTPSTTFPAGSKSFNLEAPDGQRLMWKRSHSSRVTASLVSLPSNTILASYTADTRFGTEEVRKGTAYHATEGTFCCGYLDVAYIEDHNTASQTLHRQPSNRSASSSSSSEAGPRIHRAYKMSSIGFCAPAVLASAIASPYNSAAMNRFCVIGDDLSNLGRASIGGAVEQRSKVKELVDSAMGNNSAAQAKYWAEQNRNVRKNTDPRARPVEMDLLVATLIAVIAG